MDERIERGGALSPGQLGEGLEVDAGTEGKSLRREEENPHRCVLSGHLGGARQLLEHRLVDRVALVGAGQGDGGEPTGHPVPDGLEFGHGGSGCQPVSDCGITQVSVRVMPSIP